MGQRLIIKADGASRGNPGPAAIGVVIEDERGKVVDRFSRFIGETTNNQAEYEALIAGLEAVAKLGAKDIVIKMDSQLVVRQLKRKYKVRKAELKPLFERANQLLQTFASSEICYIPREQNREADRLARAALDVP